MSGHHLCKFSPHKNRSNLPSSGWRHGRYGTTTHVPIYVGVTPPWWLGMWGPHLCTHSESLAPCGLKE